MKINFVIKDGVGSEASRLNMKFMNENLRPKSYKRSQNLRFRRETIKTHHKLRSHK